MLTGVIVAVIALTIAGVIASSIGAGLLQILGIALAGVGVGVVRSALERATQKASDVKRDLEGWWALREHQLRGRWARLRGLPRPTMTVSRSFQLAYHVTDELVRQRPMTAGLPDRDWLAALDGDLDAAYAKINAVNHSLAVQRQQLGREIVAAGRQGWQLIVFGLFVSAVGTIVGMV
jgi:hypothetical protein